MEHVTRIRAGQKTTIRLAFWWVVAGFAKIQPRIVSEFLRIQLLLALYGRQPAFFVEGTFIVPDLDLQIGTIVSMPFDENTYIAHLAGQNDCIVFDPGFEPDAIIEYLDRHSLTPAAIVCTHGHSD